MAEPPLERIVHRDVVMVSETGRHLFRSYFFLFFFLPSFSPRNFRGSTSKTARDSSCEQTRGGSSARGTSRARSSSNRDSKERPVRVFPAVTNVDSFANDDRFTFVRETQDEGTVWSLVTSCESTRLVQRTRRHGFLGNDTYARITCQNRP